MSIQTKTMTVKSDTSLAETTTTIRDTVTLDVSNMPNGITYRGLKAVLSFAEPIQWNRASTYDALTVVWDDASHGSYASKRRVPQNIELANEFYWLRTADLDAQVEMYRQEVREFDGRITANADAVEAETVRAEGAERKLRADVDRALLPAPATRKVKAVIIGDSFTDPGYIGEGHLKWWQILQDTGWECHVFAQKGAGFVQPSDSETGNRKFIDCVNDAVSDSSFDHGGIERVIIYGGGNDIFNHWSTTPTEGAITNAMNACVNALSESFPYADIEIYYGNAGQGWEITSDNIDLLAGPMLLFPKSNQTAKIVCATPWLASYFRNSNLCETGHIHPNSMGHKLIAGIIGAGTDFPTRSKSGNCFGAATTDNENVGVEIEGALTCSGNGPTLIYGLKCSLKITAAKQIAAGTAIDVTVPLSSEGFHVFGNPISFNDFESSACALRFIRLTNKSMTFTVYALREWSAQYRYSTSYNPTQTINIVGY